MYFSLIAAVSDNGVIGNGLDLPWDRIKSDLSYFRKVTLGNPVIMGRRTWESLKRKALPGRANYIVSSTLDQVDDPNVIVVRALQDALDDIAGRDDVPHRPFVIGGAQLYQEALKHPKLRWMDLTTIHLTVDGDVKFPDFDAAKWLALDSERVYDAETNYHLTRRHYRVA